MDSPETLTSQTNLKSEKNKKKKSEKNKVESLTFPDFKTYGSQNNAVLA